MKPAVSRIVTQAITSPARRRLVRTAAGMGRKLLGEEPVVDYFHQADDPYSHLAAQLAGRLAARYGVRLRPWIVPPPDDSAAPERARLAAYAIRDAARLAAARGLEFPPCAVQPGPCAVSLAQRILVAAASSRGFSRGGRRRRQRALARRHAGAGHLGAGRRRAGRDRDGAGGRSRRTRPPRPLPRRHVPFRGRVVLGRGSAGSSGDTPGRDGTRLRARVAAARAAPRPAIAAGAGQRRAGGHRDVVLVPQPLFVAGDAASAAAGGATTAPGSSCASSCRW